VSDPTGVSPIERRRMALLSRLPLRGNQRRQQDGGARTTDPTLTPRQRQVLDGLIRGVTNKEIAAELGIGPDAVKRVVSRLLIKLNAPSRAALVQPALQTDAARRRRSQEPNALSLLDAVPVPALVTRGATHRIEYANPAAKSVLTDVAPGIGLVEVLPSGPRRTVERIANDSFALGTPRVARDVAFQDFVRVGASWRRADVFTTPIHDGVGKLAGLVIFLVDVSNDPRPMQVSRTSDAEAKERARPA
jgi:DNA-binding CsgD family transcriptional regulator